MLSRKEETKHLTIDSFEGIVYRNKVTQRLRHLDIVDIDKTIVHPVISKSLACLGFRLGNFVGVVWKLKVSSTTVNIDSITQNLR